MEKIEIGNRVIRVGDSLIFKGDAHKYSVTKFTLSLYDKGVLLIHTIGKNNLNPVFFSDRLKCLLEKDELEIVGESKEMDLSIKPGDVFLDRIHSESVHLITIQELNLGIKFRVHESDKVAYFPKDKIYRSLKDERLVRIDEPQATVIREGVVYKPKWLEDGTEPLIGETNSQKEMISNLRNKLKAMDEREAVLESSLFRMEVDLGKIRKAIGDIEFNKIVDSED